MDNNVIREDESMVSDASSEYNSFKDFTSLEAWKKARIVKLFFYQKVIPLLPLEERFNLAEQIRRAAISITANVAEGYGRYHYQEGIQFYRTTRGSLYELKDHIISCSDLEFIDGELLNKGIELIEDAKRTLGGYIRYTQYMKNEP